MDSAVRTGPTALAILALIVAAGLALRVGYAIEQPATRPPDARAYARIAANLYEDGAFDARSEGVAHEIQPSSAYSPGLPLLVAGVYVASGGVHETAALILLAILGAGSIPMAFLLGRRFAGDAAGLLAAGVVAGYPALLEYQGLMLTEPLAAFLLSASLVAYFHAGDSPPRPGMPWGWVSTGALLGLLALVRPEYLLLAFGLPLLQLARQPFTLADGPKTSPYPGRSAHRRWRGMAGGVGASLLATLVILAPWAIRNAVELHRFVPVSTGGGKALFIGTYLDAGGDSVRVREELLDERPRLRARFEAEGPVDDPDRMVLERVLERVADESYPGLETDAALARLGRRKLEEHATDEPLRFAGMLASKTYDTWTDAARGVMLDQPWRALQLAVVVLALAGLAVLLARRRFEGLVVAITLLHMTAVAALLIASPRRELVVLPLLAALAGSCAVEVARRVRRPARG